MENYSEEILQQIKIASNLLFTPGEIAVMVGIVDSELFTKQCLYEEIGGKVYKAYQSGKLEQEMVVRKAIFLAAKNGSPPAQSMAFKLMINNKMNER